jgi:hypothetical protein
MHSNHLLSEDMVRDCENAQGWQGMHNHHLHTEAWTEIVKMVSSRLAGNAEQSLTS